MKALFTGILEEITGVLRNVDEEKCLAFAERIRHAKRIFIAGEGRSGLMGKAFAMRLMHADYPAFVVGETITPNVEQGDMLLAISGSGTTGSIQLYVGQAKRAGADVVLITTNEASQLAESSDFVLRLPAATKRRLADEPETIQPLGNQFDQSLHLLLDAVMIHIVRASALDPQELMARRHTNLQ
ncbi:MULTISPECIES: 6-phospho-3-hexuloisomerase [Cohnella]|jgi:6-phospho-3-hexuloisomerase|uniref:6-phospho-3-hexuloisomerase n=1 Tax=Cohnella boryungensis TaxID=768479 RepID=A0ABV8S9S6_9BACL|nr:6-phospho-3-hexuloisomerase [Cohnella sp. LGH]QTH40980.1 6-phospho-3-hexuloisomerase [Cohnella sp. LGH]